MPDPLVDVGLPAYGEPTHLREAIESVLGQSEVAWRLVVSDNGPGGGDIEAAVKPYLTDPRVHYIATGGVSAAENWSRLLQTGLARYVTVLSDDDRWAREFLARRITFLDSHPHCALVFSNYLTLDREGGERAQNELDMHTGAHPPPEFIPRLYASNPICSSSILLRRDACRAVGDSFSERFSSLFDHEMWFRLALRYPVGYLAVRDCGYRSHEGSLTKRIGRFGEQRRDFLDHADRLIARELPTLVLDRGVRRRTRSFWSARAAADALEGGNRRRSRVYARSALRSYPPCILDPRVVVTLLALMMGERGARLLTRLRSLRSKRRLPSSAEDRAAAWPWRV